MRHLGAFSLVCLLALAVAYVATSELAPRVRVRWRDGLTSREQAVLETTHFLRNGRDRFPEGSLAYDLLDTSRSNIRRLVEDPAVADTGDIDRDTYVVEVDTDRGVEWIWVAHRLPGLRHFGTRWALIALLAAATLLGLRRECVWLLRMARAGIRRFGRDWSADRQAPAASRDIFDALPWQAAHATPARRGGLALKLGTAAVVLVAAGPPVLETWEVVALAVAVLAIVFGDCRREWWRLPAAAVLVVAIVALKGVLPRADIAEGHNSFLLPKDGGPLEQGLPPEVFANWKAQFDALYPHPGVYVYESWRDRVAAGPDSLYAQSTDAIWREAKYTRQVDTIGFRSLAEFRGGFANDLGDNFWLGDIMREEMPFYVMYELTAATVGSHLRWTGQLFWERADGSFEEVRHDEIRERPIESGDAGKRVFAVIFPKHDSQFEFHFVPSTTLRIAGWIEALLTLLGIGVVSMVIRPQWPAFLRAASVFLVAFYVLLAFSPEPSAARLGKNYLPHGGGNDGLPYEAHGRAMAFLVGSGNIIEALKGTEAVFGSTPGTRYVRMVEKLAFGDTNHLFALMLAGVPIVVWYLMRRFIGAFPAWVVTGVFLVLPGQHLSFLQYFTSGRAGYADWMGAGFFLFALTLLLYHPPAAAERRLRYIWTAGAALAAAMCVRPHVGLAVAWVAGAYAWGAVRSKDFRAALVLAVGLGLAVWVPFHNWSYGHEINLTTRRENTSLDRGLIARLAAGESAGALAAVGEQLTGWLWNPGFAYAPSAPALQWPERLLRIAAFAICVWVAFVGVVRRRSRAPADLVMMASAALWAHVAVLLVFGHHQRYLLAWDLSMVVAIVWLVNRSGIADAAHDCREAARAQGV